MVVGVWLIVGGWVWLPAMLAALHLVQVLVTTGINGGQYRDLGLLGGALALMILAV